MEGVFALFLIVWLVGWTLTMWALVDSIKVPDDSLYRAGNKLIWVLVILFANFVGAIIYFAVGRPSAAATAGPPVPPRDVPPGAVPPGDVPPMPPPPAV
jgi:hypothetical protein